MKEILIDEAHNVINEFPCVEMFIDANFSQWLGGHGICYDNSVELYNYWNRCKQLVDEYYNMSREDYQKYNNNGL